MPRNHVAIYSPGAASLYASPPLAAGGAERQTRFLAAGLAGRGLRVAHIVLPVDQPSADLEAGLTLVQRRLGTTRRGPFARMAQLRQVWSALAEADAEVYVFRSGLPALGVTAAFCRLHRRRLVFAVSSDLDLTLEFFQDRRPERALYAYGVRHADVVVVQSRHQVQLAGRTFPEVTRVVEIPSFAATAPVSSARPEAFLWVGRLDRYKQPVRYLELAEALPDASFWMIARRFEPERGSGSPGANAEPTFEDEVRARANRTRNVRVLEARPHAEAMELLDRAVAIVNTGRAEGMPNLFLEAWARGIPVLSYEFDPDARIERQGLGEFADGSSARFEAGARRLWDGRDDRQSLAQRLHSYVVSRHSVEAVTSRWATLVQELRAT